LDRRADELRMEKNCSKEKSKEGRRKKAHLGFDFLF